MTKDYSKVFKANLKRVLEEKGITVDQFCDDTGIHINTWYGWGNKKRRMPTLELLIQVSDYVDVSIDELLGRKYEQG